jgi:hypothetical protein
MRLVPKKWNATLRSAFRTQAWAVWMRGGENISHIENVNSDVKFAANVCIRKGGAFNSNVSFASNNARIQTIAASQSPKAAALRSTP